MIKRGAYAEHMQSICKAHAKHVLCILDMYLVLDLGFVFKRGSVRGRVTLAGARKGIYEQR